MATVKLRNITRGALHVAPVGRIVDADCLITFDGDVVGESADAYEIETKTARQAWPKATWRLESGHAGKVSTS